MSEIENCFYLCPGKKERMFSKACEYGIRATLFIASQPEGRVSLKAIAAATSSPEAFTAKILQQLVKNNIIQSIKGPSGGFEMTGQNAKRIKLSEIVNAIDGDSIYRGCALGLKACSEVKPCPLHDQFKSIRNDLRAMLENTSVHDLSSRLDSGLTFLKQ